MIRLGSFSGEQTIIRRVAPLWQRNRALKAEGTYFGTEGAFSTRPRRAEASRQGKFALPCSAIHL